MARHRNYRNYAYEDDMSDDVYGHSVEDYDMAVSPTTAAEFMFRRSNSRDPNLSAYMVDRFGRVEEEDEEESDEEPLATSQDYRRPQLDPRTEEKLSSCLDQLHSILGENLHEPTAVTAIMQNNFDTERALDQILSQGEKQEENACSAGIKGSVSYQTQSIKKVKMYEQNNQCKKEVTKQLSSVENETLKTIETTGNKSAVMSLSSICQTSSSNSFAQGSSVDGLSSHGSVLQKPQQPVPLLSPDPKIDSNAKSVLSTSSDGTSLSERLFQIASQNPHTSSPLSCLSSTAGLQSQQTRAALSVDPSEVPLQNVLLSAPLSSLSQSGGSLSGQPVTSSSLLAVPLNSLSGQVGVPSEPLNTGTQNPPLTLNSLSQLSSQQGSLSFGPFFTKSDSSPLLLPLSSLSQCGAASSGETPLGSLLKIPLSTLSQTSKSVSQSDVIYQSPSLPVLHNNLPPSGSFAGSQPTALSSSLWYPPKVSQQSESSQSLSSPSKTTRDGHGSGTTDVKSLDQKLTDMKILENTSKSSLEEKDFNHNQKMEHRPLATPVISSLSDSSMNQEQMKSLHARDGKQLLQVTPSVNIHKEEITKQYVELERRQTKTQNNPTMLRAKPTMFALTLCYSACTAAANSSANKSAVEQGVKQLYNLDYHSIAPFDFCSPSPDDIVNERQKGAFVRKKR